MIGSAAVKSFNTFADSECSNPATYIVMQILFVKGKHARAKLENQNTNTASVTVEMLSGFI